MGTNQTPHIPNNILEQNCRPEWPEWTCIAANICGLTSTTLWFVVLLPQIYKNFRRKSVEGLSILWATANFTASLVNLLFVYEYAKIPLYGKISSVYMPVLEFTMMVQFWIYRNDCRKRIKYAYAGVCIVLWATILTVQSLTKAYKEMEWIAIGLWCIETFPQVILNMKLGSTRGQSNRSVLIAIFGKMTDFLATYGLVIPIQYVIMTYFSSSVAYVNGIQVAWYYKEQVEEESAQSFESNSVNSSSNDSVLEISPKNNVEYTPLCSHVIVRWHRTICCLENPRRLHILKGIVISFLLMDLILFVCGLAWATKSFWCILAPCSIIGVLVISYLVYVRRLCVQKCRLKE